jgi:membrane protein DedA with SNARE-associated domain
MNGLIALISGFVLHHPSAALVVAFAAAVLEAVVIVGALVPGTAVMMTVAGVAATAGLPKLPFLLVAAAGAAVGDVFSYWVGARYGGHLRKVWPLSRYPRVLARAEAFFASFGTPSVFLARFVPGLRAAVPLVAGMAGMELRWFLAADLFAAVVWAPMHILPVQFAGLAIDRIRAGDWRAGVGIGGVLLLLAVVGYVMHRVARQPTLLPGARPQSPPVSRSRRDAAAG